WNPLPAFVTVQDNQQLGNVRDTSLFCQAAADGTLPAVAWVMPNHDVSEHPQSYVTIDHGEAYVTSLVNAVMNGPNWQDTAIFVTWDDWGGFYDHVVPPQVDDIGYSIRVPGL